MDEDGKEEATGGGRIRRSAIRYSDFQMDEAGAVEATGGSRIKRQPDPVFRL